MFKDWNHCIQCENNYFLDQWGECIEYPKNPISNCNKYLSLNKCLECKNLFLLFSESECLPVKEVDNCILYNGSIGRTECLMCHNDYFLKDTVCILRKNSFKNSMLNCEILNPT